MKLNQCSHLSSLRCDTDFYWFKKPVSDIIDFTGFFLCVSSNWFWNFMFHFQTKNKVYKELKAYWIDMVYLFKLLITS